MKQQVSITLNAKDIVSKIDDRLFGSFIEHMGRAIYTGIYEPDHPSSNKDGFRQDVIDLITPLCIPIIRYPGGNFVSGYRWEDGVGPKEARPTRPELAWSALESNQVGTNEFLDFLKQAQAQPMLAVNLGTRGPQEAADLLEYCNFPSGTHYSDLRISHGYPKPHNVKLWCLGNEMDGPWQICAKTADEYGRIACETAKMMKCMDSDIELVACGSSSREMLTFGEWERTVLRHTYEYVDYLSLHTYYKNNDNDLPSFLASSTHMNRYIKEVGVICAEIKAEKQSEKDIYLSFDEWNVWYHFQKDCSQPSKWMNPRPIEEDIYDFADALLVGSLLITLINNSDIVRISCLAQLVNTIAPIMTEPGGGSWVQTIYYPFLYTSQNGRGTALTAHVDAPLYNCAASDDVPFIDCASVLSKNEDEIVLFVVNKNLNEDIFCVTGISGFMCEKVVEWVSLFGCEAGDVNTIEHAPVQPRQINGAELESDKISFTLPRASWNMLRVKIAVENSSDHK